MKKIFLVFIILGAFINCTPEDRIIPPDVLPVDTMKLIIWHLTLAGDYAASLKEKDSSIKKLNTAYFSEVLNLHHIDKKNFIKSFNFYQNNLYFNKILFDSVNAYSSRQRNEIYKYRQ